MNLRRLSKTRAYWACKQQNVTFQRLPLYGHTLYKISRSSVLHSAWSNDALLTYVSASTASLSSKYNWAMRRYVRILYSGVYCLKSKKGKAERNDWKLQTSAPFPMEFRPILWPPHAIAALSRTRRPNVDEPRQPIKTRLSSEWNQRKSRTCSS